jgi:hypothetical protein
MNVNVRLPLDENDEAALSSRFLPVNTNYLTISYNDLVRSLAKLESDYGGNSTRSSNGVPLPARELIQASGGNLQYFSVDSYSEGSELPVVVVVGANYSQGGNQLPTHSQSGLIGKDGPFIEANLSKWRKPLERLFEVYKSGFYDFPWHPGVRPHPPLTLSSALPVQLPENFHFVMTNFTPWITTIAWATIRDMGPPYGKMIIDNPPHVGPPFEALERLKAVLPGDTLWVGHGNYDVHDLFIELVAHFHLNQWLFCTNLTYAIPWLIRMLKQNKPTDLP